MKRLPWHLPAPLLALILTASLLWSQEFPELGQLINSGQLVQAQEKIESELQGHPDHPELLYWKAALAFRQGRAQDASATLEQVIEKGLAAPPHFLLLGQIYSSGRDWKRAAETYRKGLARQYSPQMAFNLARTEFELKNYQVVIEAIKPLAENPQATAPFHHLLGLAYFALNRFDESLPHLAKALESEPENPSIHYDLGLALLQARRFEEAVVHLEKTVQLQPTWARGHLFLGRALHDLNRGDDALLQFQEAERLKPNLPLLQHHYGLLHRGRGEFDQAIAAFEKEIAAGTGTSDTLFQLADTLFNRRQFQRSRSLIEKALQASPDNAEFHLLAAKLTLRSREFDQVQAHIDAALKSPAQAAQAYFQLGRLRQAQGREEEAKQAFEQSRRLSDQRAGRP